jgi:integrase/recombinase XerD
VITAKLPALPVPADRRQLATLDQLAPIPEEEIWLAKQKSRQTRRAYRLDVRHFMATLGITTTDELRQVDHRAVIAWERTVRKTEHASISTVRKRSGGLGFCCLGSSSPALAIIDTRSP